MSRLGAQSQRMWRDERGAAMIEMTIILPLLLLMTSGIAEFGFALWQWNGAEKATQMGVRLAVVSDPVATELASFECGGSGDVLGTPCRLTSTSFEPVTCTSSGCSSYGFSSETFAAIVAEMQAVYPWVEDENVVIEYANLGLGFYGRGSPIPAVTVRLTGMTFRFFILEAFGFGEIEMPEFPATLVGEDLNGGAVS